MGRTRARDTEHPQARLDHGGLARVVPSEFTTGFELIVDETPQSHVDLDDPTHLHFEYIVRMGAVIDQLAAGPLTAVHLGHVHDGYMVNLTADNIKLRDRAARIVAAVSGRSTDDAARLLEKTGGAVKTAILLAAGVDTADAAEKLLEGTGQRLRPALSALGHDPEKWNPLSGKDHARTKK